MSISTQKEPYTDAEWDKTHAAEAAAEALEAEVGYDFDRLVKAVDLVGQSDLLRKLLVSYEENEQFLHPTSYDYALYDVIAMHLFDCGG